MPLSPFDRTNTLPAPSPSPATVPTRLFADDTAPVVPPRPLPQVTAPTAVLVPSFQSGETTT